LPNLLGQPPEVRAYASEEDWEKIAQGLPLEELIPKDRWHVDPSTIASITPFALQKKTRTPFEEPQLRWVEGVIASTQNLNARGQSIYPKDLENFNSQLFANASFSWEDLFIAMDFDFMYPATKWGIRHVMQSHLPHAGVPFSKSLFPFEEISTILSRSGRGFFRKVPPTAQAATKFYIFLKYCLFRFSFVRIEIKCDEEGIPLLFREGETRWSLAVYVSLEKVIGNTQVQESPMRYIKIIFFPLYNEQHMQFVTAYPISLRKFNGARDGELFYLHTPGEEY
jgi:hypothetical protein